MRSMGRSMLKALQSLSHAAEARERIMCLANGLLRLRLTCVVEVLLDLAQCNWEYEYKSRLSATSRLRPEVRPDVRWLSRYSSGDCICMIHVRTTFVLVLPFPSQPRRVAETKAAEGGHPRLHSPLHAGFALR